MILKEKTQANKSASTSTSKDSELELPAPTLFGRNITLGAYPFFNNSLDSANSFDGERRQQPEQQPDRRHRGDRGRRLSRTATCMVRGEKVLTLNQGSEVIRISGLVRAVDVTPENTVLSTQIADAQITYSGTGAVAESNQQGWLGRFFNSAFWPF